MAIKQSSKKKRERSPNNEEKQTSTNDKVTQNMDRQSFINSSKRKKRKRSTESIQETSEAQFSVKIKSRSKEVICAPCLLGRSNCSYTHISRQASYVQQLCSYP